MECRHESVRISKLSIKCGFSPKAFQIRPTVDFDNPDSSAIDARDQCAALGGCRFNVAATTCSICSSLIRRGAPGRGPSVSPSNRLTRNRCRHLPTVCCDTLVRRLPVCWFCLLRNPTRSDTVVTTLECSTLLVGQRQFGNRPTRAPRSPQLLLHATMVTSPMRVANGQFQWLEVLGSRLLGGLHCFQVAMTDDVIGQNVFIRAGSTRNSGYSGSNHRSTCAQ